MVKTLNEKVFPADIISKSRRKNKPTRKEEKIVLPYFRRKYISPEEYEKTQQKQQKHLQEFLKSRNKLLYQDRDAEAQVDEEGQIGQAMRKQMKAQQILQQYRDPNYNDKILESVLQRNLTQDEFARYMQDKLKKRTEDAKIRQNLLRDPEITKDDLEFAIEKIKNADTDVGEIDNRRYLDELDKVSKKRLLLYAEENNVPISEKSITAGRPKQLSVESIKEELVKKFDNGKINSLPSGMRVKAMASAKLTEEISPKPEKKKEEILVPFVPGTVMHAYAYKPLYILEDDTNAIKDYLNSLPEDNFKEILDKYSKSRAKTRKGQTTDLIKTLRTDNAKQFSYKTADGNTHIVKRKNDTMLADKFQKLNETALYQRGFSADNIQKHKLTGKGFKFNTKDMQASGFFSDIFSKAKDLAKSKLTELATDPAKALELAKKGIEYGKKAKQVATDIGILKKPKQQQQQSQSMPVGSGLVKRGRGRPRKY